MSAKHHNDPDRVESAVLLQLLDLRPAPVTRTELSTRMLAPPTAAFDLRDAVEVAIIGLVSHGLVHDHDGWLLATQPAVHTARLLG